MDETVLKMERVAKLYRGTPALDAVTFSLYSGRIYGLAGQNGAGKTTLMRLATGLSFATGGRIELFGEATEKGLAAARKMVGSMIERPGVNKSMTAAENMRLHRMMRGIPGRESEQRLLKLVGLGDTGRKKAGNFSMGMRQRLGIALALIGSPRLLILDEPINGLDPVGVVEIRGLLKRLCEEEGLTILLSSHNLAELYQTATDYIILHRGRLRQTLTQQELEEHCRQYLKLACREPARLASLLDEKLPGAQYKVMPDGSVRLYDHLAEKDQVAQILYEGGLLVTNLSLEGDTLENYYLDLIGRDKSDEPSGR